MVGTRHPSSRPAPLSIVRPIHLQCILPGLWATSPPQRQPATAFEKHTTTPLLLATHLGVLTFQPRTGASHAEAPLIGWHLSVLTRPASPTRYLAPLHTQHPVCRCIGVAESCITCNIGLNTPCLRITKDRTQGLTGTTGQLTHMSLGSDVTGLFPRGLRSFPQWE